MNNVRRKTLNQIVDQLQILQAEIESVMCEEEEYRDNMPENLQSSERYEKADEACSVMQDAIDGLEDVIDNLATATE